MCTLVHIVVSFASKLNFMHVVSCLGTVHVSMRMASCAGIHDQHINCMLNLMIL